MALSKLSGEHLNNDSERAMRAVQDRPVGITERGRPAYVLITIEKYERLCGGGLHFDSPCEDVRFRPADIDCPPHGGLRWHEWYRHEDW